MPALAIAVMMMIGGIGTLANAAARRVQLWMIYALGWAGLYIGGLIVCEYFDPGFFSTAVTVWVLLFTALTGVIILFCGGDPLRAAITVRVVNPSVLGTNPGEAFTYAMRFAFMVGLLIGMFFQWCPPSLNWGLFGAIVIAFVARLIGGSNFDFERWKKVATLALALEIAGLLLSPMVKPLYASHRWSTIETKLIEPATSMYAVTIQDTPAWECHKCDPADGLNLSNLDDTSIRINTGTWLQVANPEPQEFRHIKVQMVHRQRSADLLEGFEERIYIVPIQSIKRMERLGKSADHTESSASNAPALNQESSLSTPPHSVVSLGVNKWRVIVPGNEEFHTGILVSEGQKFVFSNWSGQVKLSYKDNYTNSPQGGYPTNLIKLEW